MNIFNTIERINRLHSLIKIGGTGNPETLSNRLGISRATLYNLLEELKSVKAPISYFFRRKDNTFASSNEIF